MLSHCYSCKKNPIQIFPILIIPISPPLHLVSAASLQVPLIIIEACIKYLTFPSKDSNDLPAWHISQAILHSSKQYMAQHSRNQGWHSSTCISKHRRAGLQPSTQWAMASDWHHHLQPTAEHTQALWTPLGTHSQLQTCPFPTPFWIKNKPTSPRQALGRIHLESYHFQVPERSKTSIFQNIYFSKHHYYLLGSQPCLVSGTQGRMVKTGLEI